MVGPWMLCVNGKRRSGSHHGWVDVIMVGSRIAVAVVVSSSSSRAVAEAVAAVAVLAGVALQ